MNKFKKIIGNFIFKQKVKKHKLITKREKKFMNYNDIHTILILFKSNKSENNPMIDDFVKKLTSEGKKVTVCGFVKKIKPESPVLKESRILGYSSVVFSGKPKKNVIADLLANEYDMVFDLTLSKILPLRYVLFDAKSPFKVGRRIDDMGLLDFMISLNPSEYIEKENSEKVRLDEDYLFNQVFFYLKSIKSNN